MQFLSQIPGGPTDFKFMSPHLQNQSFAGGVKIPTFDMSKFAPQPPGPAKRPPPGAIDIPERPGSDGNEIPDIGSRANRQDLPDFRGGGIDPLGDMTSKYPTKPEEIRSIAGAWEKFKQEHPNWSSLGVNAIIMALSATTGIGGAIIGKVLRSILLGGGGQTLPSGRSITDPNIGGKAPGTKPPAGIGGAGMPVPDLIGGGQKPPFTPTPKPSLPWDTPTYGGDRQKWLAEKFKDDLRGVDIFDQYARNSQGSGFGYGGAGLL